MSFINVDVSGIKEPEAVDEGPYTLIIASVSDDPSKAGKPMLTVIHEIDGHPDASPIYHYLPLPCDEDEPKARNFKALSLKRYCAMLGIDPTEGFDTEDLLGESFECFVTKEEIDQEDPTAPPQFRNGIRVPRLSE